ncbi:beta-N-acetylhexosaminidase [Spirochaeta isovalerica]|uniref:beta-N-acetylhexosaminidase n=1 Tax=Spirochaeta isovalerica TaxID=150 RepID=A0A841R8L7_9SPIO|nr:beta-N-acetylhexosaminidase [Spirochaeta isovalerica]MBB6479527.1 hexosaminidase [Spirochaeta isovalerica]
MSANNKINLIPEVSEIKTNDSIFTLKKETRIAVSSGEIMNKGHLLRNYLTGPTGYPLPLSVGKEGDLLLILEGKPDMSPDEPGDERYSISVTGKSCILKAPTPAGLARAIQTFRQLLGPEIFSQEETPLAKWEIPGCEISDYPRFGWRGMHLDVCRHFFSKEEVMRFIDLIALHRFNRFHFHLTEDQGWRIEIKKYPKLTEVGAWRDSTLIGHAQDRPRRYDDIKYGGFYTQEDIKEIVAYATIREITIVPEIDMPGHMQAAIAAYPELGCTDQTLKSLCHWGICEHILNVEESTINFMKDVLDEVMSLFPGKYIHIGGDEALKYEWEEQRRIQDRMAELGLKGEMELQSWFIRQMAEHIQSKGREVIGWDEILEGGLADGAAVMSWRGEKGGIEAAELGHKVVMAPEEYVYFDHYQGDKDKEPLAIHGLTTVEKVYSYDVLPKELPADKKHLIMGSQGQLWSEYIPDFRHLEYMAFPRVCALAEVLWTSGKKRDFSSFQKRLEIHKKRLDKLEVNYRKGI